MAAIAGIDPENRHVELKDGATICYDYLVIATATSITPQEIQGLLDSGWRENIFDFYTFDGHWRWQIICKTGKAGV